MTCSLSQRVYSFVRLYGSLNSLGSIRTVVVLVFVRTKKLYVRSKDRSLRKIRFCMCDRRIVVVGYYLASCTVSRSLSMTEYRLVSLCVVADANWTACISAIYDSMTACVSIVDDVTA